MNVNLPRWMFTSMSEHFRTVAATQTGLNYHAHGIEAPESADYQSDTSTFRMSGPTAHQGSSVDEWYDVEIMILLNDIIDYDGENAYKIYDWAGAFQGSMLNDALGIYKYGTGVGDDQSLINCLEPDPSVRSNVRVVDYGIVDKDLNIHQIAIIGRFILQI